MDIHSSSSSYNTSLPDKSIGVVGQKDVEVLPSTFSFYSTTIRPKPIHTIISTGISSTSKRIVCMRGGKNRVRLAKYQILLMVK